MPERVERGALEGGVKRAICGVPPGKAVVMTHDASLHVCLKMCRKIYI